MPGKFSYTAAANPAFVTGGTAGPAAERGYAAPWAAQAPAHNLALAGEVVPVASRGESHNVGRMFS
jgi:hypothetical protein